MIYEISSNPYLNIYAEQMGIKIGDSFKTCDYLYWIDYMHDKFQSEVYGSDRFDVASQEYVDRFIEWMKNEIH